MHTLNSTWGRWAAPLAGSVLALAVLAGCEAQTDHPRTLGVARAAEAPDEATSSPLHEVTASTADAVPLVAVALPSGKVTTAIDNLAASTQALTASGVATQPAETTNTTLMTPTGAIGARGTSESRPPTTRP